MTTSSEIGRCSNIGNKNNGQRKIKVNSERAPELKQFEGLMALTISRFHMAQFHVRNFTSVECGL